MTWRAELREYAPRVYEGWLTDDETGERDKWSTGTDAAEVLKDTIRERDGRNSIVPIRHHPNAELTHAWEPDPTGSFVVDALGHGPCWVVKHQSGGRSDNWVFFHEIGERLGKNEFIVRPVPFITKAPEEPVETREQATQRFHDYWKGHRPSSFLEVFLEGAKVK